MSINYYMDISNEKPKALTLLLPALELSVSLIDVRVLKPFNPKISAWRRSSTPYMYTGLKWGSRGQSTRQAVRAVNWPLREFRQARTEGGRIHRGRAQ